MDNNRRRIELLNSLLFSLPGTPIIYYGDEIGMGDNVYLGDRNGVRTPMQWNPDRNAGFSRANPAMLYSPVIMDPVWGYEALNVEAQQSDPSSLLNWMRNMIALRKLFRVFGRGTLEFLAPANRKILAYLRRLGRRTDPVRDESLAFRAAGGSRSRGIGRHDSGRNAGVCRIPAHHAATVSPDSRTLRHSSGSNCTGRLNSRKRLRRLRWR